MHISGAHALVMGTTAAAAALSGLLGGMLLCTTSTAAAVLFMLSMLVYTYPVTQTADPAGYAAVCIKAQHGRAARCDSCAMAICVVITCTLCMATYVSHETSSYGCIASQHASGILPMCIACTVSDLQLISQRAWQLQQ